MRGSLGTRIAFIAFVATLVSLASVLFLAEARVRKHAEKAIGAALGSEARFVARLVEEPLARGDRGSEIDLKVRGAGEDLSARVSVFDSDGRLLSDSGAKGPMETESEPQPEVLDALRGGSGRAVRPSGLSQEDFCFGAIAVQHQDRTVGVVRVGQSIEWVNAQVHELMVAAFVALALAVVTIVALSGRIAFSFARPLREIMRAAREFSEGNLDARIQVPQQDEFGELATILNSAVREWQSRLAEAARDRVRTEAILSAMEDGVLAVDDRGTVLIANGILRRSLGLTDPVGRHYVEVIRQREVGEVLQAVLSTGERQAIEVSIRHLRRVYALTAVPFPGVEGSPPGAVLTFHDVTERRRLEQVRRDFVANASHELRTPLTSIRGFVEALEDGAVSDSKTAERFLGKIHLHSDRMAALVEDLLELSRLESGEGAPRWEEVFPAEVAEDVVASFAGLADRKGTSLTREDRGEVKVFTDADRLRRILENLVDNAVKYTPEGGRVQVTTGPAPGGGALVEVTDNGNGIPPEHLPRIFERFYRVDKARSRELGGTGLGLAIVKHLAEGMGATIAVKSDVGKGTSFQVTLPPQRGNT
jgi:two-component system phosphate regulon sensor histidine kinase PhoR